jgi:predicted small lipoprotein YifL
MTRRFLLLGTLAALLAACGRKGPLKPPPPEGEENEGSDS